MKNYTLLGWLITVTMSLLICIGIFITWQLYRPINILEIDNLITVSSASYKNIDGQEYPVVYKNEELFVNFHYIKYLSLPEHTFRTILCEDGNLVTLTDIFKNLVIGEHSIESYNGLVIPQKTSSNILCYVRFLITYEANHFRTITVPTQTELFYVMEKPLEVIE